MTATGTAQAPWPVDLPPLAGLIVAMALAAFPATMFAAPAVANASFAALALAGLALLARDCLRGSSPVPGFLLEHWTIVLAMGAIPLVVALRELLTLQSAGNVPYLYLRFALFVPIAWLLVRVGPARIAGIRWGLIAGALVSAVWIHSLAQGWRPPQVGGVNVIPFGNLSLLMGMLALAASGWRPPRGASGLGLGLVTAAAGIYASILSEARGGWIAIPILVALAIAGLRAPRKRDLALAVAGSITALAVAAEFSERVRVRIVDALAGLRQLTLPDAPDSSVSVRVELWQAALDMLASHPLAGVGVEGFVPALQALANEGRIGQVAATLTHAHNDVLHLAATLGAPGLAAVLAAYLVPAWHFGRRLRHQDRRIRAAAAMGLMLCAGFVVFGLTEAMLVITLTNAFYSLAMAACFAFIAAQERAAR